MTRLYERSPDSRGHRLRQVCITRLRRKASIAIHSRLIIVPRVRLAATANHCERPVPPDWARLTFAFHRGCTGVHVGGVDQQNKSADLAPDWALWLDLLAVNVSQCAALSLNLDPLKADQAPGQALQQELQRRRLVIGNHADNGGFCVTGRDFDRRTRKREPRLPLADFVLWALARSWRVPGALAHRFAPPSAPLVQQRSGNPMTPFVLPLRTTPLYSISETAWALTDSDYPEMPEPTGKAGPVIARLPVFKRDASYPGLFWRCPKPGHAWHSLEDAEDWDEQQITDEVEILGLGGYPEQARTGYPAYTPTTMVDGAEVFKGCIQWADTEWTDWSQLRLLRSVTFVEWARRLRAAAEAGELPAFDFRGSRWRSPRVTDDTMIYLDHLREWMRQEEPLRPVVVEAPSVSQVSAAASTEPIGTQNAAPAGAGDELMTGGMVAWKSFLIERRDKVAQLAGQKGQGVTNVIRFLKADGAAYGIKPSDKQGYEIRYLDRYGGHQYVKRKTISNFISDPQMQKSHA